MAFAHIEDPHAFRVVRPWPCSVLEKRSGCRALGAATIRRKLSALSLFESQCEANAVQGNPVDGVKRPTLYSRKASRQQLLINRRTNSWPC